MDRQPLLPSNVKLGSWVIGLAFCVTMEVGDLRSQTIDRMLAIVEGRVITLNDVREYRALARVFGDSAPEDDAEVIDDIIEDMLVDDQIRLFAATTVSEAEVDAYLATLGDDYGSLSEETVREAARARLVRQRFFEARFLRFSVATPAEIESYYETVFLPAAEAQGLDPLPSLDRSLRADIERNVTIEKADRAFLEWLQLRIRRSSIEVVE